LQAIWRAAAANPAPRWISRTTPSHPMTASRPIVGKPDSYALRAESTAIASKLPLTRMVSPRAHLRRKTCITASIEVASALPLLSRSCCRIAASAEGVGALLAGDLARSGSKPGASVDQTNTALRPHDRFAANRRQAGLLRPAGRINRYREQAPSHTDGFAAIAYAAQDMHYRIYRGRIRITASAEVAYRRIAALPHCRIAALPLLPKA